MRRLGLFEGSILDPALVAEPTPCPPVEKLRHPTHWATYRTAAATVPDTQAMVVRTQPVQARTIQPALPGLLARRSATQMLQGATAAVLATLGASTAFYWHEAHIAPESRTVASAAFVPPAAMPAPSTDRTAETGAGRPEIQAAPASAPAPAAPPGDVAATAASDLAAVQPGTAETALPTAAALQPAAMSTAPPPSPDEAPVASNAPPGQAAIPGAPAPLAVAKPVVQARVVRATFATSALIPAEPGASRIPAHLPHAATPHAAMTHPVTTHAAAPSRPEMHLVAARSTLPHWLTESRKTPLIMSEPPHNLTLPPTGAGTPAADNQATHVQAAPTRAMPPLRAAAQPATATNPQPRRWYGGPVYTPYGAYRPYAAPYAGYGYRPYGPYGYDGMPGPYGAPPTDVTIQ